MARRVRQEKIQALPEGFTLSMAIMDTLPVLFFSIGVGIIGNRLDSQIFLAGAILVILAGALKAGWKFMICLAKKDVRFLNRQMRYLMPVGFVLMVLGLIVDRDKWDLQEVVAHCLRFPSILFLILGILGIAGMIYLGKHANGRDAKANWMEQGVNSVAQLCFLLAIWK